ncbi:MAG: hypothetical protein IJF67_02470 [Clostridia bacterium]|nr:hypothetical protein [Clostridia bacterium]
MRKTNKSISILLLAAMLASLAACGGTSEDTQAVGESTDAAETLPAVDEYGREVLAHSVPAELDFGGAVITFAARDDIQYTIDFAVEEQNGEIVNDAVFRRNSQVEDELNVKFEMLKVENINTTSSESVGDMLRTNVMAGDSVIDICGVYQIYGASLAGEGLLYNLNDLPHTDFEQPWWNQTFYNELNYKNQLHYAVGAMNLSVTSSLFGVFFNQAKVTDYHGGYDFLYELVYDGKWTLDKFTELVKDHYQDLNGNNEQDKADFYGMMVKQDDQGPWTQSLGIRLITKDSAGIPQLSYMNEKTVDAYEKLFALYRKTNGIWFGPKTFDWRTAFANGQSMYATLDLGAAETHLRDMKDGYGILPMPKYDEAQTTYYNNARDTSNLTCVATNTKHPEAVGAALELLNYYSYQWVTPAYFEVAMKAKYLADSDSANMFDIIVDNVVVDFGVIHSLAISGGTYTMDGIFAGQFRNLIRRGNENVASNYAKFEPVYKEGLAGILAKYDALAK